MKEPRRATTTSTPSATGVLVTLAVAVLLAAVLVVHAATTTPLRISAAIGLAVAAGWDAVFLGWRSLKEHKSRSPLRAVLGWTTVAVLIAWSVVLMVSFPKYRTAHLHNVYGVGALAFGGGLALALLAFIAISVRRNSTGPQTTGH